MNKILLVAIIISIGTACRKPGDEPAREVPVVKQMRITFTGNPPDPSHVDFRYDHAGRVSNFFIYMGDSATVVASSDSVMFTQFTYAGSNRLPGTVTVTNKLQGLVWSHYLSYNADNRLSKDSVPLFNNEYYLHQYSYNGNFIIDNVYSYFNHILEKTYTDTIEMINGNLINFTRRYSTTSAEKVVIEYDNKINPLNNLNISPIFIVLGTDPTVGPWSVWTAFTKNNQVSLQRYIDNVLQNPKFLEFHYDGNGLPSHRLWRDQFNHIVDTLVFKY